MKNIIERKLPLNTIYTLTDKKYISLLDGMGCTCDNCGKMIANIATVSNGERSYNISFDCLDTILLNNCILSDMDIVEYQSYKAGLSKIMKFIKHLKDVLKNCQSVTGLKFESQTYESDWYTFYYLHNGRTESRDNSNVKIKGINFDILVKVVSDYFKTLTIINPA